MQGFLLITKSDSPLERHRDSPLIIIHYMHFVSSRTMSYAYSAVKCNHIPTLVMEDVRGHRDRWPVGEEKEHNKFEQWEWGHLSYYYCGYSIYI